MSAKVGLEIATSEVNGWLDYKKVSPKKREAQKEQIDALVDGIMEGVLVLQEDKTFVHTLKFPSIPKDNSEAKFEKLEYKPRVKMSTIHAHLQGVKPGDADGRICAYIAALSATPKAVLSSMETEDYSIAQAIAIFFL